MRRRASNGAAAAVAAVRAGAVGVQAWSIKEEEMEEITRRWGYRVNICV